MSKRRLIVYLPENADLSTADLVALPDLWKASFDGNSPLSKKLRLCSYFECISGDEPDEVHQAEQMLETLNLWIARFQGHIQAARDRAEHIYYENIVYDLLDTKTHLSEALARIKIRFRRREDSDD